MDVSFYMDRDCCSPCHQERQQSSCDWVRPISILNNFSKVLKTFMITSHFILNINCVYLSVNFFQLTRTATDIITCLNTVAFTVCSLGHVDPICLHLTEAFPKGPRHLLLNKPNNFGLLPLYTSWFLAVVTCIIIYKLLTCRKYC
jgi:hypothetical protein